MTWATAREAAMQREQYRCGICGYRASEVNHRVPRKMGGRNNDDNKHALSRLIACCSDCHDRYERHARSDGYRVGFFVPDGIVASEYPVLYRDVWALLDDDGNVIAVDDSSTVGLYALAAAAAAERAGRLTHNRRML